MKSETEWQKRIAAELHWKPAKKSTAFDRADQDDDITLSGKPTAFAVGLGAAQKEFTGS